MIKTELRTIEEVFEALGDIKGVCEVTGNSFSTVWNWRKRKSFPSKEHFVMTNALEKNGLSAPRSLWGMKEPANG